MAAGSARGKWNHVIAAIVVGAALALTGPAAGALDLGVRIDLPAAMAYPGLQFQVDGFLDNPGASLPGVPVVFILDVYGQYWFWDGWGRSFAYQSLDVAPGTTAVEVIPPFAWPDTGPDTVTGLRFWGAMLNDALTDVRGVFAMVEWGYGPAPTATPGPFTLASSAFEPGQPIPDRHTCTGADLSPPLAWTGAPAGTLGFALFLDDPDAPSGSFVHWLIYDLPAATAGLPEGVANDPELPDGSRQGENSFGRIGYDGPCPPAGQTHEYVFTLYALDAATGLAAGAGKAEFLAALEGHVLGTAVLTGTYIRP